jgi:transposase
MNLVYFYLSLSNCHIKFLAFSFYLKAARFFPPFFFSLQFILQPLKMSMQFFYEDGQGRVVDENGVEPMDLVVDEELFAIETISSRTQFLMNKPPERYIYTMPPAAAEGDSEDVAMELSNRRRYTFYSNDEKTRFFHLFFNKCLSAAAAARQLGIHVRVAQRWVRRYREDPESIFEKKKRSGWRRILGEEHKKFLLNYIDDNPSAVVTEVIENLKQNFVDLNVSRTTVYNFMTAQCNLSIKQAQIRLYPPLSTFIHVVFTL